MVREWTRHWEITIRFDRAENSPWGTTRFHTHAATPAQLRRLVEAARADPHCIGFPYRPVRVLVGTEPTHCPNGHPYPQGRVAGRLQHEWTSCRWCGGHLVLFCPPTGCPTPGLLGPPLDHDCVIDARRPGP